MKISYSKSLQQFVATEIQEGRRVILAKSDSLNDVLSQVGMLEEDDETEEESE